MYGEIEGTMEIEIMVGYTLLCLFVVVLVALGIIPLHSWAKKKMPRTNGDRIRALSDEELADKIMELDIDDMIPYCRCDNALCNEMLDRDELVPAEMCKACCVRWLQKEAQ